MELVQPIRDREDIEEMKDYFLRYGTYRDYFLFVMGINTGLRISDLLKLKVKDVRDKTHITLRETKTGKNKRFMIKSLTPLISKYTKGMDSEDFLFSSRLSNKPITRIQAYRILNKAADMCGLQEVGTHTLRKTFGYHHYKKNKDVATLQTIFNHSTPTVTLRYIGIEQDEVDSSLEDFLL